MVHIEDRGFDNLAEQVVKYMKTQYPEQNQSFKVFTRRVNKRYPMESMEVSAALGERILDALPGFSVDVHHPDIELHVEIRKTIYIYSETIPGPGGMPLGTNGRAMLLLSGGIDSPVAGYMIAKRGVYDRCGIFPCAAVHQRAGQAEGGRPGKTGVQICRPHPAESGELH